MGVTCHFVDVMAALTSRPVVAMKAWEFAETVEGMLLEGDQSLDGVGLVIREQVPLLIAFFLVSYLERS